MASHRRRRRGHRRRDPPLTHPKAASGRGFCVGARDTRARLRPIAQPVSPNAGRSLAHPPRQAPASPPNPLTYTRQHGNAKLRRERSNLLPNLLRECDCGNLKQVCNCACEQLPTPLAYAAVEGKRGREGVPGSPKAKEAVEIAKNPLDIASYKLYYVNYEIRHAPPSPQPDSHKGFDTRSGVLCPAAVLFGAAAELRNGTWTCEPATLVLRGFRLCELVSDVLLE